MQNNIKKIREARGVKQAALAEMIGTYPQQMSRIESNQESIDFKWIDKIAAALDVAPWELVMEPADRHVPTPGFKADKPAEIFSLSDNLDTASFATIPLYDIAAAAGHGMPVTKAAPEVIKCLVFELPYLRRIGNYESTFGMFVYGDSMAPVLPDGALLLIDTSKKELWQGKMYLIRIGEMHYVKYIEVLPGLMLLKSANKAYDPIRIDLSVEQPEDFEIMGTVIWYSCEG